MRFVISPVLFWIGVFTPLVLPIHIRCMTTCQITKSKPLWLHLFVIDVAGIILCTILAVVYGISYYRLRIERSVYWSLLTGALTGGLLIFMNIVLSGIGPREPMYYVVTTLLAGIWLSALFPRALTTKGCPSA